MPVAKLNHMAAITIWWNRSTKKEYCTAWKLPLDQRSYMLLFDNTLDLRNTNILNYPTSAYFK